MAQQVRALTSLLKVLSSNPSNHMVAHNHPVMRSDALFWCCLKTATVYLDLIMNKSLGQSKQALSNQS